MLINLYISDVQSLQDEVKFLELLARLQSQTGKSEQAAATLNQAKEQQAKYKNSDSLVYHCLTTYTNLQDFRVVKRGAVELGELLESEKKLAAKYFGSHVLS